MNLNPFEPQQRFIIWWEDNKHWVILAIGIAIYTAVGGGIAAAARHF